MSAQIVEVVDAETLGCGFEGEIRQGLDLQMWEVCLLFKGAGESLSSPSEAAAPRNERGEGEGEHTCFGTPSSLAAKEKKRTQLSQPGKPRPRGNSVRNSVLYSTIHCLQRKEMAFLLLARSYAI